MNYCFLSALLCRILFHCLIIMAFFPFLASNVNVTYSLCQSRKKKMCSIAYFALQLIKLVTQSSVTKNNRIYRVTFTLCRLKLVLDSHYVKSTLCLAWNDTLLIVVALHPHITHLLWNMLVSFCGSLLKNHGVEVHVACSKALQFIKSMLRCKIKSMHARWS